ncbi:MAG: PQQ-binding-like beta-propeller repeat protein [Mariniblastus sp.]|nr:PQQ-binding-like beta-propeller repeat protein [Mariniblastus sp.]
MLTKIYQPTVTGHSMRFIGFIPAILLTLVVGKTMADDWPMYRKDAGRMAICQTDLPSDLTLRWTRQLPPLKPAFHNPRLQFDAGYEPVSAQGILLIASSQTDSVLALDAMTGNKIWTFQTNGPVRCAPAIWKDRVCFGSDDGHLYCVELSTGKLCWKHQAAPSDRRLMGNKRLISVWPIRGGPVVADGRVYFAAGVWPFEGVFVYAMEIATGAVEWRNDRMGYLFGRQPHNTEAIGGLAPQGYLLIDKDELVVPCSTAYPARLNRHTGELIDFQLPSPGRLPGGWFSQLDPDTSRALRRGTLTFDDVVNRQKHEGKEQTAPGGVSGLSRQIQSGNTTRKFDDGFPKVTGKIHSMIISNDQLFVVTREGTLSCFASDSKVEVKHWPTKHTPIQCADKDIVRAKELVEIAGNNQGIALILGIDKGALVRALIQHSNYQIIAFDDDTTRATELRRELQAAGVDSARAAVILCDLAKLELPPYLATIITTERLDDITPPPLQSLRPFGGIAAMGSTTLLEQDKTNLTTTAVTGNFKTELIHGEAIVRRIGALPGATEYSGNWAASPDTLVRFPLGVLWFDDSLAHFKRSPQPSFIQDVMISRPKDWQKPRPSNNVKIDYPLLPAVLSDIYTGRVLADEEKTEIRKKLPESDPSQLQPSQYRPPHQTNPMKPKQPIVGERTNPLTGLKEPRVFPKTYGCDGGVDYGRLYTLRSGTPAFYDKTIESGTVFLSGPRSGCTNSIIPSGGVLNVPYFFEGCTCSYPLPSALSLIAMPQRFEQWSAWGEMKVKSNSIQRIGLNFGAPGDRMTSEGTLWLDYPSVGGPSPAINVLSNPGNVKYRYRHSMWMSKKDNQPWVTASMAEGLESIIIKDLKPGKYQVSLYFAEPDNLQPGERIQNVQLQDNEVLTNFDILAASREVMQGIVFQYHNIAISGMFELRLTPVRGTTLISGIELCRQPNSP